MLKYIVKVYFIDVDTRSDLLFLGPSRVANKYLGGEEGIATHLGLSTVSAYALHSFPHSIYRKTSLPVVKLPTYDGRNALQSCDISSLDFRISGNEQTPNFSVCT